MALFVNQDESRTRLQQEIAAELQAKAKKRAEEAELPDGVDDSRYIENTERTAKHAWVWAVIAVVIIGLVIVLAVSTM